MTHVETDADDFERCADFEPCGVCGYDHAYEWPFAAIKITAAHVEAGDVPEDYEPRSPEDYEPRS